jgi:lipopolysaccharide/colanic/teichoic acid biosynthesis glycosyltransferase
MTLLTHAAPLPFSFRRKNLPALSVPEATSEVLYLGQPDPTFGTKMEKAGYQCTVIQTREEALVTLRAIGLRTRPKPAFILAEYHPAAAAWWRPILKIRREDPVMQSIPLVLLGLGPGENRRELALQWQALDVFDFPFATERLCQRMRFLQEEASFIAQQGKEESQGEFRIPRAKRLFDIAVASMVLLLLSPLLLLVALLIKLESPGPIFYISKRVGTGYQVFPFMKFRSMHIGADRELKAIDHLNQYGKAHSTGPAYTDRDGKSMAEEAGWNHWVIDDKGTLPEAEVRERRAQDIKQSFVKVANDPRVTRVGRFIRNTSIDELPQLLNVLRGDMSIVGNRPLPLYEAEKLTSDAWTLRFLAPAGITGWWQVTERGKASLDPDSRKARDVEYAKQYSIWMDLKILAMTIPALFQQENV